MAVDIGAGSGRIFTGAYDGKRLTIAEECRFFHKPVTVRGESYLNFLGIWDAVKDGMMSCLAKKQAPSSIGFDSFAPDFCMVDREGTFFGNILSYRTMLATNILEEIYQKVSAWELFSYAGVQGNEILMLPQLLYLLRGEQGWILERCQALPLVNAIEYLLTGVCSMDFTTASVSMLWDNKSQRFSDKLLKTYFDKTDFLPEVQKNQSIKGHISHLCGEEDLSGIPVVNSGVHDTAMATYALDMMAHGQLCMNCGTWTSLSIVVEQPVIHREAFSCGLTNYGLPNGKYMFGTVMLGMFYLQECKAEWASMGKVYSYEELTEMAMCSRVFCMDLDDTILSEKQYAMTHRIALYFTRRHREAPATIGEYVRCIIESLVLKYSKIIKLLERASGRQISKIYLGGGGIKSVLLRKRMQEELGKEIICVTSEVTVVGNLLSQLIALGELTEDDAEQVLRASL